MENYATFGPFAVLASLQNTFLKALITDPIKAQARIAVRAGKEPDIYRDMNGWIYKNYRASLYDLCRYFMKDDIRQGKGPAYFHNPRGASDAERVCPGICTDGVSIQLPGNDETQCDEGYAQVPAGCDHRDAPGGRGPALHAEKRRWHGRHDLRGISGREPFSSGCLYKASAFDPKEYSERITQGRIGCSDYEIVRGSKIHNVRLRHYVLPKGIKPNGKVLYISTPLINKPELFDLDDGKSVVQGMLKEGYAIYLVDYGSVPR